MWTLSLVSAITHLWFLHDICAILFCVVADWLTETTLMAISHVFPIVPSVPCLCSLCDSNGFQNVKSLLQQSKKQPGLPHPPKKNVGNWKCISHIRSDTQKPSHTVCVNFFQPAHTSGNFCSFFQLYTVYCTQNAAAETRETHKQKKTNTKEKSNTVTQLGN